MEEKVYLDKLAKETSSRRLSDSHIEKYDGSGVPCLSLILKRCWIRLINRLYPVQSRFFCLII